METVTKKAYDLHAEHATWTNTLNFYKDEIIIFQKRIDEIASKNSSQDVLKLVESFYNRLKIQRNEIDNLKHNINDHETYIKNKVDNNPAADHKDLMDHKIERDSIETFEKMFAELRKELYSFLSKHM